MKLIVGSEFCVVVLAWSVLTTLLVNPIASAVTQQPIDVSNITRIEDGDTFSFKGAECIKRECGGRSESLSCSCVCPSHAPLFREDRGECVNDISDYGLCTNNRGAKLRLQCLALNMHPMIQFCRCKLHSWPRALGIMLLQIPCLVPEQFRPRCNLVYRGMPQFYIYISECSIAPFGSGSSAQRVPYVFLPLKGQIIHPSKDIRFPGVRTPICAVSGAQFLTRNGFVDLRNTVDADVPFSLFRDEGRTFLQWTGETDVRSRMEGRLLVVHLLCRDVGAGTANGGPRGLHGVFTPCAAFRVAGSPTRHVTNVSEVLFAPDARSSDDTTAQGLTMTEYIAIGVSSVLLGLIYVASIFLYLHIKRKRSKPDTSPETPAKNPSKSKRDSSNGKEEQDADRERHSRIIEENEEDGVVKNNPLMGIGRHFHQRNGEFDTDSDSCHTDIEDTIEEMQDRGTNTPNGQSTSLTVHPVIHDDQSRKNYNRLSQNEMMQMRDDSGNERLPEENVSIIETLDIRDEKPETVRAIGTTRRKLYFNPAYFEPQLLIAPPPAAIEFLVKIREVISIAKHKMATRRFMPSLIGIPEEETCYSFDNNLDFYQIGSQRSSIVSLKRENNRRRTHCSGCPGCSAVDMQGLSTYISNIRNLGACHSCSLANGMNKQTSIRKWLEGVPILKSSSTSVSRSEARILPDISSPTTNGLLNSLLSLPKEKPEPPRKYYDFTSRSLYAEDTTENFIFKKKSSSVKSEPSYNKFSIPLPSFAHIKPKRFDNERTIAKISDISPIGLKISPERSILDKKPNMKHALPDMINEALAVDKNRSEPKNIMKKQFNNIRDLQKHSLDYETDSLERNSQANKGLSTPTEYGDVSSSQASPSLSNALPMDEEMTMRNAIYKINSTSRPSSRHSVKETKPTLNPDYEIVEKMQNDNSFDNHIYAHPELLSNTPADYSLVTEVYVNNGYNFGSTPTSPSESDCSTFGKRKATIKGPDELPGHLTIEVKDSPDNYIQIHESDSFEPDTLDRKPSKLKLSIANTQLDRNFILGVVPESKAVDAVNVTKSASFSSRDPDESEVVKDFSSLRQLYEANETKSNSTKFTDTRDYEIIENTVINPDSEEGRLLTLESRHSKRQRQSTPPSLKGAKPIPPDVIPPTPPEELLSIYEYPKPPRKVTENLVPPLPPKNENGRSPSSRSAMCNSNATANPGLISKFHELSSGLARSPSGASVRSLQSSDYENIDPPDNAQTTEKSNKSKINFRECQTPRASKKIKNNLTPRKHSKGKKDIETSKIWKRSTGNQYKEDSGYLSTDSNDSRRIVRRKIVENKMSGSDTDDTGEDARSESGAESVETHSVFFGSLRKASLIGASVDSGTGSDLKINESAIKNLHDELDFCQRNECDEVKFIPFDNTVNGNSITSVNC